MIRVIIFDFDGVIVDSNHIKTDAFVKLFEDYPQHIKDSVRKFHLENGGMSRFDKFRYIYANFIKESLSEDKFKKLCSGFNKLVAEEVIRAPIFEGVEEFLKKNRNRYRLYIVSGTPEGEIREIVKRRKLNGFFQGVYGSPASKKDLIEKVLKETACKNEEALFIGDSINDYEGAVGAGVTFAAKISEDLGIDAFPGVNLEIKIKTIMELEEYLNEKAEI
jgi:HAD superfamily hydrolase (TIGR01549 family)